MKIKYNLTDEQVKYLKQIGPNKTQKEIAKLMNEKYNLEYNDKYDIEYLKKKYNIISMKNQNKYNLTKKEIDYIKNIVKGKTCNEIAMLYNKKFNKNITEKEMEYIKRKNRITSGIKTTFKKNSIPHNLKKELSEYNDGKGGIKIKVGKEWIPKGRYIYEKHHGKIKENEVIVFLDGNKKNFDINNLMAVSLLDVQVCGIKHLKSNNSEITKIGLMTAQLINKSREKEKEYGKA